VCSCASNDDLAFLFVVGPFSLFLSSELSLSRFAKQQQYLVGPANELLS
jgi:hypothetical protein